MIDSHCHLADPAFAPDLPEVIERARTAGVQRAMCILAAGDIAESAAAGRVRELWPGVRVAVGVHPHQAGAATGRAEEAADAGEARDRRGKGAALGEIGLDYHYDFSPPDVQQDVFSAQVTIARTLGLPIVIHTREATQDTFDILKRAGKGSVRGMFHCFTGDVAMARTALDLGFHISISGIVTFPRPPRSARSRRSFLPIACSSKPTRHTSRRRRSAASATSRRFVARVLEVVAGRGGPARVRWASNWCGISTPCWAQLLRRTRLSALTPRSQNQYCGRNCISTASI